MTDNISIKSQVDSTLIDRVEQECYQILYHQRLLYNERWYSFLSFKKIKFISRLVGLSASIFGVILCVFYLVYPSTCPKWFFAKFYLLFFIGAALLFYYLPRLDAIFISRMKNVGGKSCKRMARRFVSKARKAVPYEVEYNFRGDLVTCFREKDNNWKQVWSKRLKGFAIMGETVTLLFRNPNSILQKMLILHESSEALEAVLKDLEIPYKKLDQQE